MDGEDFHDDAFADFDECEKDDFMTLDDSRIYMDQGENKCDPDEPQVQTVEYRLSDDGNYILFDEGLMGGTDSSRIMELAESTLKLHSSMVWEEDEVHSEITYKHLNK